MDSTFWMQVKGVALRSIATLSLTLQVTHQSAVNQTNTGFPEPRASARAASL